MTPTKKLKILFVSAEVDPLVKSGGLADVARALPLALQEMGHDVRVVTPLHHMKEPKRFKMKTIINKTSVRLDGETINFSTKEMLLENKVTTYLVDNPGYFAKRRTIYNYVDDNSRFAFFSRAALKITEKLEWYPDVIHANEWTTGAVPNYFKLNYEKDKRYKNTATVFAIHNLAYQGPFDRLTLREEEKDAGGPLPKFDSLRFQTVNFLKRGIIYSDAITTVSEQYAKEITTPEFGMGLDGLLSDRRSQLYGIVNGVDYKKFNPSTDPQIAAKFDKRNIKRKLENKKALQEEFNLKVDPRVPILSFASRFWGQKGFSILKKILPPLLRRDVQIVGVGEGDPQYHAMFRDAINKNPKKIGVHMKFDTIVVHRIYAGADMFLMPSKYEPCGIGQIISLRYGTVPIVRATGGLVDTVKNYDPEKAPDGTGFLFKKFSPYDFFAATIRALETYKDPKRWNELVLRGMSQEFSWKVAAKHYLKVYEKAIAQKKLPKE